MQTTWGISCPAGTPTIRNATWTGTGASAPATSAEVAGADAPVPVQVALRIVGVPAGQEIPQVVCIHLVVATVHVRPAVIAPGVVVVAAEVDEGPGRIDLAAFVE